MFYVQYGHARGFSISATRGKCSRTFLKQMRARRDFLGAAAMERLSDPAELGLLRRLALYPRTVEAAAMAHEPHRIAFYLYDLASEFHRALDERARFASFTLHYQ